MDLTLILDKIGDFSVLGSLAILGWAYHSMRNVDNKFRELELDLAKNYVTKPELKRVEDKLDNLGENLLNKIENVNTNILQLLNK